MGYFDIIHGGHASTRPPAQNAQPPPVNAQRPPVHNVQRDTKLGPPGGALVAAQQKARRAREARRIKSMAHGLKASKHALYARLLSDGYDRGQARLVVKLVHPGRRTVPGGYTAGISEHAARQADPPDGRLLADPMTGNPVPLRRIR